MTKERPILFIGAMVRAILDGRKTQTRRVVKPQPEVSEQGNLTGDWLGKPLAGLLLPRLQDITIHCPHGQPGDRLYVREAWWSTKDLDPHSSGRIAEMCLDAGYRKPWTPIHYEADGERRNWEHTSTPPHFDAPKPGRYRHARFMPSWASRIQLEITGVRVERLQDCSEADAMAEGVEPVESVREDHDHSTRLYTAFSAGGGALPDTDCLHCDTHVKRYEQLWGHINGAGAWEANPWVRVVEFWRVQR